MTAAIREVRPATAEEWETVWERCSWATFFHSREWAELWLRYTAGALRPDPVHILFDDGASAVLPLCSQSGRLQIRKRFESSPAGTYGGWISADALREDHGRALVGWLRRSCPDLVWRVNPYVDHPPDLGDLPVREDHTRALDLSAGREAVESLWTSGGGAAGRKIRAAERHGVEVRVAQSAADWEAYDRCYRSSLARWGARASAEYGPHLFRAMSEAGSPWIRLWLATHRGRVVAGALCLESPLHTVYWHGAAEADTFELRPVNLLLAQAVRAACAAGRRWFDFNPSGGHVGVDAFKASFGASRLSSPVVELHAGSGTVQRLLAAARTWR